MKRNQILKQQYEISNSFDEEAMFVALKAQVSDKVFSELINREKHSLSIEFRVFVNEEESSDKDPNVVNAMEVVKAVSSLNFEGIVESSDTLELWRVLRLAGKVDTSKFK